MNECLPDSWTRNNYPSTKTIKKKTKEGDRFNIQKLKMAE